MVDYGHSETEKLIAQMEKKVAKVYQQAAQETQKKLEDYLKAFERKDKKKRELLDAGEITKKEYNDWRTGQIMISKRWEEMRDTLAQDYHNANNIARSVVNGYMPEVYALNHNYGTFQVEKESLVDTSYTLYDRQTVERLMREDPELLPMPGEQMKNTFKRFDAYKSGQKVDLDKKEKKAFDKLIADNKDIRWQKGQIQSVMTQAILQGESVPHMAQRVARTMGETNRKATTRYVRTAATGAQNAGRVDSYKRAQDMGIELEQEWLAILDNRTRHEHRLLDGEHVPVGKPFEVDGKKIRFPGDPTAPGYLIWNCRCTLIPRLKSLDNSDKPMSSPKLEGKTYEEWKYEHIKFQVKTPDFQTQIGKATSVKQVDDLMNNQGWFRTNSAGVTSKVNLAGCDLESAKSIASTYQQIFDKYPQLKGRIDAPDAHPIGMKDNTYAWCYIRNGGKIQVNPNIYNSWRSVVKSYERDVISGWHPYGTTAESIVAHEMGHAVDGLLAQRGVLGGYTSNGEFRYASSSLKTTIMKRAAKSDPKIASDMDIWPWDKKRSSSYAVTTHVSEYASKNSQEWFAECFAEYITSANPRAVASEFGKELEKLLGRL